MEFLREIDHSAGEAASTPELNAAKGRRGRLLKQRCPGPWGRGMARADGSPLRAEGFVKSSFEEGEAGSSLPSSGIHSLSSTSQK